MLVSHINKFNALNSVHDFAYISNNKQSHHKDNKAFGAELENLLFRDTNLIQKALSNNEKPNKQYNRLDKLA